MDTDDRSSAEPQRALLVAAWAITLVASNLPEVVWSTLGSAPAWLPRAKLGILMATVLLSRSWRPLRDLYNYAAAMLAVFLAIRLQALLLAKGAFHDWAQRVPWALGQTTFRRSASCWCWRWPGCCCGSATRESSSS